MPHFNSRGDIAHGVGGGNASVNNQPFSPGAVGGWLDDDTVLFMNGADAYILSSYHVPTKRIQRLDDLSCNVSYAGGGVWAAWLGAADATKGLRTSTGFHAQEAGLLGVGVDGAIGFKPSYQSTGPSMVREKDGREWQVTPGHAAGLQLLGNGQALWMEGYAIRTANLPTPKQAHQTEVWKAQAAFAGGWWVSYFDAVHGIVLHPFDALEGFVISPGAGWHSITALTPTILRVAVATSEGEQAGQLWVRDLDVSRNLIRDPWGVATWSAAPRQSFTLPLPVPPPAPPAPPPPMSLPNHLSTLIAVRAKYPELVNADQAVAIMNEVAWIHRGEGFGLLRKDGGNHGPQPRTGIFCSVDWLVNSQTGTGFDAGGDGPDTTSNTPGHLTPNWGTGEPFDTSRFVAPVEPVGVATPPPVPPAPVPPPTPAIDLSPILAKLDELLERPAPSVDLSPVLTAINALQAQLDRGFEGSFKVLGQSVRFTLTPKR